MGSPPVKKTIGIVAVAALAARAALLAIAKITTTCCRTWLKPQQVQDYRCTPITCQHSANGAGLRRQIEC